jgi:hypothetical protein
MITGIALNLFVFMIPALPLIIAAIINVRLENEERMRRILDPNFSIDYEVYTRNLVIAEIFSPILLIILLPTLIHKLYRKWYALPEQ